MKTPTKYLFTGLSFILLLGVISSCTLSKRSLPKQAKGRNITFTPEKIVNINGRLEFECELTYTTRYVKKYDSLEYRFYIINAQIETYIGSMKDVDLKEAPYRRSLNKKFKTVWYSKGQDSDISMEAVYYKKGKASVSERLSVSTVYSKP